MNCLSCGTSAAAGAQFCGVCGGALQRSCAACAGDHPAGHRYCDQCGSLLAGRSRLDGGSDVNPVRATAEGERRHMTVMFCDLVGSTAMSESMDPEELKSVVLAYHQVAAEAIEGAGGYVGHYMGDGILAYFGYPVADEHAGVRAVRAGFRLIDAVHGLHGQHPDLEVRVGVHSGLAVVADMGAGENRQLRDVVGDTPNTAARVQGAASPGTVAVSAATWEECKDFIEFRSLGPHTLRGLSEPVELFEAISDSGAESRLDVAAARRSLTPMVGREGELDQLLAAWRRTQDGDPQVVWVTGEPGIGKSRLVREFISQVRNEGGIEIDFRCSVFHQQSSLHSSAEQFRRFLIAETGSLSIAGCELLADTNGTPRSLAVPVIAGLLNLPLVEPYRMVEGSADHIRQHTLEVIARLIEDRARRQPVLVVVDDVQWIDATTAALMERFLGPVQRDDVMTVVTCRIDHGVEIPTEAHHHCVELTGLPDEQVQELIRLVAGDGIIAPSLISQVSLRTEGIPLFAEELTQLMMTSPSGSAPSVPATLRDSLMARIDRLGPEADLLRVLSIFARDASDMLLQNVSGLDRQGFLANIELLMKAGLVIRRGTGVNAVYSFRHALQQEVTYESMLRTTRRQLHGRVAAALELRFSERSVAEPEMSARHLELSGDVEGALPYLLRAGDRAIAFSAHAEALAHLEHALEIVASLPPGPDRDDSELEVLVRLGVPTTALHGYGSPAAEGVYARAQELGDRVGDHSGAYQALYGLHRTRMLQAKYAQAEELGKRLAALAEANPQQIEFEVGAARAVGSLEFYLGRDQSVTLDHLERALNAPDAGTAGAYLAGLNDVVDPVITCQLYAAWANWLTGNPKQARQLSDAAVDAARNFGHPFTLCLALCFDTWLCQFEGDARLTLHRAQEGLERAEAHGFPFWVGWARVLRAWAEASLGNVDALGEMRAGLDAWMAQGSGLGVTYFLGLIASVEIEVGDLTGADSTLAQALHFVDTLDEHFWEAELLRLRAEVARSNGAPESDVEAALDRAAQVAHGQRADALAERIEASRSEHVERR